MKKKKRLNFKPYTSEYVIVDGLDSLHEKYIKCFIDLQTHYSLISAEFFVSAQQALTEQYEAELALLREQSQNKTDRQFYLAQQVGAVLGINSVRRRFRWYDSQTKKALNERARREAAGELEELYAGIEPPDVFSDFIERIADGFVPAIRRNRFIVKRSCYVTWLLTEYSQEHGTDDILNKLVAVLVPSWKHKKFIEKNGEYLKYLISECMTCTTPDDEPATPLEEVLAIVAAQDNIVPSAAEEETNELIDELDELHELEEELSEPEPATSEERNTSPQEAEDVISITEEEQDKKPEEPDCLESEQLQIETDSGEKKQD